jgi:hypothetical protein
VRRDRLAQRRQAGGVAVVEGAHRRPPRAAVQQPPPLRERERVDVAAPVGEVVARRLRGPGRELDRGADVGGERAEAREAWTRLRHGRSRMLRRQPRRHEGAGAGAAGDEAFGEQVLEGRDHHRPRHGELLGEVARRRQAVAGGEGAAEDRLAKTGVDLARQGFTAAAKWYQRLHEKWLF